MSIDYFPPQMIAILPWFAVPILALPQKHYSSMSEETEANIGWFSFDQLEGIHAKNAFPTYFFYFFVENQSLPL